MTPIPLLAKMYRPSKNIISRGDSEGLNSRIHLPDENSHRSNFCFDKLPWHDKTCFPSNLQEINCNWDNYP